MCFTNQESFLLSKNYQGVTLLLIPKRIPRTILKVYTCLRGELYCPRSKGILGHETSDCFSSTLFTFFLHSLTLFSLFFSRPIFSNTFKIQLRIGELAASSFLFQQALAFFAIERKVSLKKQKIKNFAKQKILNYTKQS